MSILFLGNAGKDYYFVSIMDSIDTVDNIDVCKACMKAYSDYITSISICNFVTVFFIFPNEAFVLKKSNSKSIQYHTNDERDLFEMLIDNRIENRGDKYGYLSLFKLVVRENIPFHKTLSSVDGITYTSWDDLLNIS